MVILNSRDQRIDPSGAACLETTDHAGCGLCEPSALINERHPLVQQPRTEASRPFHAVLSSAKSHGGQTAVGLWRLPVASPPLPRPSGYHYVWKTTEEIKWKHKSATRFLPFPRARRPSLFTPQHRKAETARVGLLCRGPVGTVALSQNSQQLVLSPNLSSPKHQASATSFLTPNPLDSEKCPTWLLPEADNHPGYVLFFCGIVSAELSPCCFPRSHLEDRNDG